MYDVLLIDDKFEEIKETFLKLKKHHIRCFYSDGSEENLPKGKEKYLFHNIQYICLDFFLENRGIDESNINNTSVATLANIVRKFIDKNSPIAKIIIDSAHLDVFKNYENQFRKYLDMEHITIIKEAKKPIDISSNQEPRFSILHKDQKIINEILKNFIDNNLRSLVIRESIEIENLIWNETKNACDGLEDLLGILPTKKDPTFETKIKLYGHYFGDKSCIESIRCQLDALRKFRNHLAHKAETVINTEVKKFCTKFNNKFSFKSETVIPEVLDCIRQLKDKIHQPP